MTASPTGRAGPRRLAAGLAVLWTLGAGSAAAAAAPAPAPAASVAVGTEMAPVRPTTLDLRLGPTAGWLTCHYAPAGISVGGRPMTYRCAARPGSAAGAITLIAPLVHTASGWRETAATNSHTDRSTYAVFARATLRRASNGAAWWVTPGRVVVRPQAAPALRLRPLVQRIALHHPAGLTVTGSAWPQGAYAVLWTAAGPRSRLAAPGHRCTSPGCQWMVQAPPGPATVRYSVVLHDRSGARIAQLAQAVVVTWSSAPTPTPAPGPATGLAPLPVLAATTRQSANWAGYDVEAGPYTAVTGTFTVPVMAPAAGEAAVSAWVGIDGATDGDAALIQAGVALVTNPDMGTPTVSVVPWWEVLPAPATPITTLTVRPGDRVTVQLAQVTAATWRITLADDTAGRSFSITQPYSAQLASAEWIVEAPFDGNTQQIVALGPYRPAVRFSNLQVAGASRQLTRDVMVQRGAAVSTPSTLSASGFQVAYGAAAPTAP